MQEIYCRVTELGSVYDGKLGLRLEGRGVDGPQIESAVGWIVAVKW